jgi:hypothetical protein
MDNLDKLISSSVTSAPKPADLDHRIMMALTEQMLRRAHRRNRQTLVMSLVSCVVLISLAVWICFTFIPQNMIWPESLFSIATELIVRFTPENALLLLGGCIITSLILLGVGTYSYRFKD